MCHEQVQISYQVLTEDGVNPGLMRAIALDITTSNTVIIEAIRGYTAEGATVPVDESGIPTGHSIYMGSISLAPANDPNIVDFGNPVAPSTDPDTLGGLGYERRSVHPAT